MSQKKVKIKGIKVFLSVQEVKTLEDLLIKSAMFKGGFSKLKKPKLDKSLH
jgi:hypothetical protein